MEQKQLKTSETKTKVLMFMGEESSTAQSAGTRVPLRKGGVSSRGHWEMYTPRRQA